MKMSLCRTCLSKTDLGPIFPDKNLSSLRAIQLFTVTGIKIAPDDELPQLICTPCTNLVNGALNLREQSSKSDKILKQTIKQYDKVDSKLSAQISKEDSRISKLEQSKHDSQILEQISEQDSQISGQISKHDSQISKQNIRMRSEKKMDSIKIEDYESSDDSNIMNDLLDDLVSDSTEEKRVCIENFESSDSFDDDILKETKEVKCDWDMKEKEFLERERRKIESKELDSKLMSLAITPYDSGGPIQCKLCSKQIKNVQNFKSHAKTHYEPQNACEECGKKFINRSHVRYHQQRVHGRKKRLACSQCSYRAVDIQQLQNHVRAIHTGERPYICDVCGDSFRMRANIAQHMRKHFGVRNLQCERCPAMFRSRSELTNHQNRVHNHIYTYNCYFCEETYKRPASVRKHLVNVHGVSRNQQLPIKCVKTRSYPVPITQALLSLGLDDEAVIRVNKHNQMGAKSALSTSRRRLSLSATKTGDYRLKPSRASVFQVPLCRITISQQLHTTPSRPKVSIH